MNSGGGGNPQLHFCFCRQCVCQPGVANLGGGCPVFWKFQFLRLRRIHIHINLRKHIHARVHIHIDTHKYVYMCRATHTHALAKLNIFALWDITFQHNIFQGKSKHYKQANITLTVNPYRK